MTPRSGEVKKARWSLIHQVFVQVYNIPSYSKLCSNTFCVIANIRLQLKAKEGGLLDGEDWYNPDCKDE